VLAGVWLGLLVVGVGVVVVVVRAWHTRLLCSTSVGIAVGALGLYLLRRVVCGYRDCLMAWVVYRCCFGML
jgi:hypothetical protein